MSRTIHQQSKLRSVGRRSSGVAVPAGVSSIQPTSHRAQPDRPAMSDRPGWVRATRICVKLRHHQILHSVPAPFFHSVSAITHPGAPRRLSKSGISPGDEVMRHKGCRGALSSSATYPSGFFIISRIRLLTSSRRVTAGQPGKPVPRGAVAFRYPGADRSFLSGRMPCMQICKAAHALLKSRSRNHSPILSFHYER